MNCLNCKKELTKKNIKCCSRKCARELDWNNEERKSKSRDMFMKMNKSKKFQERNSIKKKERFWVEVNCMQCNKEITIQKSRYLKRSFCSLLCSKEYRKNHLPIMTNERRELLRISGKKSGETRKLRGSQKGSNSYWFGRKRPEAALRIIETMQSGKMKKAFNTKIEREFKSILNELGESYNFQFRRNKYMFDFEIPRIHGLIECDGSYWHSLPKTVERDKEKERFVIDNGYSLFRFTDSQILEDREGVKNSMISIL